MANPPFNLSDWGMDKLKEDVRWQYGLPPAGNANFAWLQHMIYHLAPAGRIGMVLANGSLSSQSGGEGEIRKNIINADLVECIVAMPTQLFYTSMLEAKIYFGDNLVCSIASETIENSEEYISQSDEAVKQDCESKAFVRLAAKIKQKFPRLPIIITADGLYVTKTVLQICKDYHWDYVIRYKEGCIINRKRVSCSSGKRSSRN